MATTVDRLLPDDEVARPARPGTRDRRRRSWRRGRPRPRRRPSSRPTAYRLLGKSGLLSLPFAEEYGGGAQPYETYLQVVEEIATAWPSVGVGVSRALADLLGARPQRHRRAARGVAAADALAATGSAPTASPSPRPAPTCRASAPGRVRDGDDYVVDGTKQWISNGCHAPTTTSSSPAPPTTRKRGLSAFLVPADTEGMSFGAPEKKMGLHCRRHHPGDLRGRPASRPPSGSATRVPG